VFVDELVVPTLIAALGNMLDIAILALSAAAPIALKTRMPVASTVPEE
jgi:hypothetical protein